MVFVAMAQAPPKAGAKDLLYSLNLIHEFTSLFSPKVIFAGLPGKAFPRKQAFVGISVFQSLPKQRPRFAQSQPKGINTPLIMYFQGGRHVKRFHLKFHFLGGGDGSVEDVGVNGAEVL